MIMCLPLATREVECSTLAKCKLVSLCPLQLASRIKSIPAIQTKQPGKCYVHNVTDEAAVNENTQQQKRENCKQH